MYCQELVISQATFAQSHHLAPRHYQPQAVPKVIQGMECWGFLQTRWDSITSDRAIPAHSRCNPHWITASPPPQELASDPLGCSLHPVYCHMHSDYLWVTVEQMGRDDEIVVLPQPPAGFQLVHRPHPHLLCHSQQWLVCSNRAFSWLPFRFGQSGFPW